MPDDVFNSPSVIEIAARDAVAAYLSGGGPLDAAVSAVRLLGEASPPDDDEPLVDVPLLGIDPATLPPEQQSRFAALQEALDDRSAAD